MMEVPRLGSTRIISNLGNTAQVDNALCEGRC